MLVTAPEPVVAQVQARVPASIPAQAHVPPVQVPGAAACARPCAGPSAGAGMCWRLCLPMYGPHPLVDNINPHTPTGRQRRPAGYTTSTRSDQLVDNVCTPIPAGLAGHRQDRHCRPAQKSGSTVPTRGSTTSTCPHIHVGLPAKTDGPTMSTRGSTLSTRPYHLVDDDSLILAGSGC